MWRALSGLRAVRFISLENKVIRSFHSSPLLSQASASNELAGKPSFARSLFLGKLETSQVFPYPNVLTADAKETLSMLVDPVTKFFNERNDAKKNDETSSVPPEITQEMKDLGLFGLQVPSDLSGVGLTNTGYARMVEIVGATDLGVGIYLGAHQSIGFKGILLVGNQQQKEKYLPSLATGEKIAAFALTEPGSGSDANSIKTRAVLSEDKKHYILNGSKIWISNGGIAEIFTVFAQTEVVGKDGVKKDKVTAFIVERSFGGVTNGKPENKMGIKCSNTAEVYFENVKVPVENVLGEVGGGFKVAMAILNNGRFGMGAALTGTMKKVMSIAAEHANNRVQFGQKIKEFGVIKEKFGQMAMKCYASESMAYMLSANMDRGSTDYQIEAAITKVFASEAAWFVCDEGIQVLGGLGFMKALPLERILRDLRIFRIFEGTNDILRLFVALEGIKTAGAELQKLNKSQGVLGKISGAFHLAGSLVSSNSGQLKVPPQLKEAAGLIEKQSAEFGKSVTMLLMKSGKKIVDLQLPVKRVAECTMDLYAMAAVVSRASSALQNNEQSASHQVLLATAFCNEANQRITQRLAEINQPNKTIDKKIYEISDAVFEKQGYVPEHPDRKSVV